MLLARLLMFALSLASSHIYAMENKYSGIKMGFEVEVAGPVKYQPQEGEKNLRHKKLLVVTDSDTKEILWSLEIDSSNLDIEIVSPPFSLPIEYERLKKASKVATHFLIFLQKLMAPQRQIPVDEAFLGALNRELIEFNTTIKFDGDLTDGFLLKVKNVETSSLPLVIRPQITYQIPFVSIGDMFNYFFSKEKFFTEKEKPKILENFKDVATPLDGFINLIQYYINTLQNGKTDHKKEETGLKQFFTIMSRVPFSEMFRSLNLGTGFKLADSFDRGQLGNKLFNFNYPIMKNPLYDRGDPYSIPPNRKPVLYPHPLLHTDLVSEQMEITVEDWIESIQNPEDHSRSFLQRYGTTKDDEKSTVVHRYRILKGSKEGESNPLILEMMKNYIRKISKAHSRNDILSPPPFTKGNDSMGAITLHDLRGNLKKDVREYGEAILEIRRYGNYFGRVFKSLEELKMFLINEGFLFTRHIMGEKMTIFNEDSQRKLSDMVTD